MKFNTILKAITIGAGLAASGLFADTVTIKSTPFNGVPDGNGGEFLATFQPSNKSFLTFCLEEDVKVGRNVPYNYSIDNNALAGGNDPLNTPAPVGGDPISRGTALLYTMFLQHTLFDAVTLTPGGYYNANRDASAGILQQAIWILENETADTGTNVYVNYVQTVFSGWAKADEIGHSVRALNLWDIKTGKDVQSQLIYVPDGGLTSVLLGLGLLSLALFRRKL